MTRAQKVKAVTAWKEEWDLAVADGSVSRLETLKRVWEANKGWGFGLTPAGGPVLATPASVAADAGIDCCNLHSSGGSMGLDCSGWAFSLEGK